MRKLFVLLGVFFIGVGVNQIFNFFLSPPKISKQKPVEITHEATSAATLGAIEETAYVSRVIDGDTVELSDGRKVRYIGIDTPELVHPVRPVECFAREAKEENRKLAEHKNIRLVKDVSDMDTYGRLLRYVYVGNVFVNDFLIRQGFAHASAYPPDVTFSEQFLEAERQAREANRGLWGGCARLEQ